MSNQLTNLTITDNTNLVRGALEMAKLQALTAIGMTAEGYAKEETPVNLGTLRNSITHAIDGDSVVIGTNVEYAA